MNMTAILKFIGLHRDEPTPLDKVQMDAAKDRLTERGDQLETEVDELSKMIRRMKRKEGKSR